MNKSQQSVLDRGKALKYAEEAMNRKDWPEAVERAGKCYLISTATISLHRYTLTWLLVLKMREQLLMRVLQNSQH